MGASYRIITTYHMAFYLILRWSLSTMISVFCRTFICLPQEPGMTGVYSWFQIRHGGNTHVFFRALFHQCVFWRGIKGQLQSTTRNNKISKTSTTSMDFFKPTLLVMIPPTQKRPKARWTLKPAVAVARVAIALFPEAVCGLCSVLFVPWTNLQIMQINWRCEGIWCTFRVRTQGGNQVHRVCGGLIRM